MLTPVEDLAAFVKISNKFILQSQILKHLCTWLWFVAWARGTHRNLYPCGVCPCSRWLLVPQIRNTVQNLLAITVLTHAFPQLRIVGLHFIDVLWQRDRPILDRFTDPTHRQIWDIFHLWRLAGISTKFELLWHVFTQSINTLSQWRNWVSHSEKMRTSVLREHFWGWSRWCDRWCQCEADSNSEEKKRRLHHKSPKTVPGSSP